MLTKSKLHVRRTWVVWETDECPDLSYLGEYSTRPGDNAIDRQERGDAGRNEFRYFNVALSGEETGNPESPEQDYARAEAYNRGDWAMVGCIAKAEVQADGGPIQILRSGGLWGIESDSDRSYLADVEQEQLAELARELAAFGLGKRAVARAIATAERE